MHVPSVPLYQEMNKNFRQYYFPRINGNGFQYNIYIHSRKQMIATYTEIHSTQTLIGTIENRRHTCIFRAINKVHCSFIHHKITR